MSVKTETEVQSPFVIDAASEVVPEPVPESTPKAASLDEQIRVLKRGSCPSLTGRSALGYQLGSKGESELYLKLLSNTGSGFFSKEWIPCSMIEQLITGATELTSTSFKTLFPNKSVNTGGFVMAVIKALGLIQTNVDNSRWHEHTKEITFEQVAIEAMVQEEEAQREGGTKGKRKPKEA
ncbi:hypothetical protein [Pseudomonas sp. 65/3-MNA-CIBAN-0223]|uniref:hypothetical protein n=1 Tax=Pseudomonas sp. 65/3-MNA-CIBAN-0223 TaxID=3140476 RepID=UPI00332C81ED